MSSTGADEQQSEMKGERIAQTVARHGVTVSTLRLYEQQGILPPAHRTPGGHRRYRAADLEWVDVIMLMRTTGMTTAQVSDVSSLMRSGRLDDAQSRISEHVDETLQHAANLQHAAHELRRRSANIVDVCDGSTP